MNEFLAIIKSNLKDYLPESYDVEEIIIQRDVEAGYKRYQGGVGIKVKGACGSPVAFVDDMYKAFCAGEVTMEEILKTLAQALAKGYEVSDTITDCAGEILADVEAVKKKVCYRLIGAEKNKGMLSKSPHRIIGENMALVYYIVSLDDDEKRTTLDIGNELAERLGLTEEQLYEAASVNTPEKYPLWLGHCFMETGAVGCADWSSFENDEQLRAFVSNRLTILLSNEFSSAVVMLYPGVLERFHKVLGDFVVFPSSMKEVQICQLPKDKDPVLWTNMVREVNDLLPDKNMILSDTAYIYNGEKLVPIYPAEEKTAASASC